MPIDDPLDAARKQAEAEERERNPITEFIGDLAIELIPGAGAIKSRIEQQRAKNRDSGRFEAVEDPKLADAIKGLAQSEDVGSQEEGKVTVPSVGGLIGRATGLDTGKGSVTSKEITVVDIVVHLSSTAGQILWGWTVRNPAQQ